MFKQALTCALNSSSKKFSIVFKLEILMHVVLMFMPISIFAIKSASQILELTWKQDVACKALGKWSCNISTFVIGLSMGPSLKLGKIRQHVTIILMQFWHKLYIFFILPKFSEKKNFMSKNLKFQSKCNQCSQS